MRIKKAKFYPVLTFAMVWRFTKSESWFVGLNFNPQTQIYYFLLTLTLILSLIGPLTDPDQTNPNRHDKFEFY